LPPSDLKLYQAHFVEKDHTRFDLFQTLAERYGIQSAMYPGSFVHITPSFVYPEVAYVDTDKRAKKFFTNEEVAQFITKEKQYEEDANFRFHAQSYSDPIPEPENHFALLISQWAGFISEHCTQHLKIGGYLLANNSHGDASMASIDERYQLVAVINRRKDRHIISTKNLESYLIPKKDVTITKDYLHSIGRGIGYTKSAGMYLFKRTN